jgi:tetratricopeptide (TPR) repeat protein
MRKAGAALLLVVGAACTLLLAQPDMGTALVICFSIGALLIAAVQVPGLVSTQRLRASETDLDRGELAAALDEASDAIDAQPWAASPYAVRATVLERSGYLAAASTDARDAIEREPDNWRHRLLLARIEAELGRRRPARSELAEARRLAPRYLYPDGPYPYALEVEKLLGEAR